MVKIRNIKQLKHEQEKLRHRQLQLEKDLRQGWRRLKKAARPYNVAKDLASELILKRLTIRGIGKLLQWF